MRSGQKMRNRILLISALAVALFMGVRFSYLATGRIAPGVKLAGVDLGWLTPDEATARIRDWSRERLTAEFAVTTGGRRWVGLLRDMGVGIDIPRMVSDAHAVGREGSLFSKLTGVLGFGWKDANLSVRYKFDQPKFDRLIDKINKSVASPARNATINFAGGVRTITPEMPGTIVDPKSSFEEMRRAISKGEDVAELAINTDMPEITAAELEQVDTLLVEYTTRFAAWRKDRTHNVKRAASAVNGILLRPGDIFSYNDTVGPRLKSNGYKDAIIYANGKMIEGTGGGICQVSSTVYNAALLADLKILERSNHSMPVQYVPLGRDATVAYGLIDLKFRNTTSAPIYMASSTYGNGLTVSIYGAARDKRDVKINVTKPKKITASNGKVITAVTSYRVVQQNGVAKHEKLAYDRYLPAAEDTPKPDPKPDPKPELAAAVATGSG